jgi:hypothetical protein
LDRETPITKEEAMSTIPKTKLAKSFFELTDEEKREATKEFEQEFISDTFRELTPQERAHWEQIQKRLKLTHPNLSYRSVKTRLPTYLIKELDALAKERKVSRSKMISLALGVYLARQREK